MERWIMNRFGFVNFWVYDTEEFELSDGKLLLRGSNASGKSITTQSIIPYILDGDRQPTSLDPFGSKDRKMEYYLLGDPENGKEESTGYLYLEFVKPESRRYRTIGIGLHAKRGSKMNTWGFCILDEKRIGYDIMLYKNAGDQNIPVDSKNLREQLGDANIFVEKPTEYKAIVAKYIFGIEKENIDDFDLLTNILIKTRSSKLASKENMKPEQLYAILNDSLRPLSDEDLRPMAESMSRIQDIHQSIDEARSALSDVREIAREYDKYNRYMLWKKGEAYMAAKNTLDTAEKDINEKLDKISELEETLDKAQKDLSEHNMELQDLEREKDSLNYGDIERQLKDKADAAERIAIEKENEKDKLSRIKVKENSLSQKQSDIDNNECQIKEISSGLKEMISKLESREEYAPPFHTSYIRGIRFDDDFYKKSEQCRREIHNYRSRLEQVLEIIKERDEKKAAFDECAASCDRTAKELEAAESELKRAEELFDETKDELINNCHIAAKNNTEYIIDEQMLKSIEELVSRYEGSGSGNELNRLKYDRKTYEETKRKAKHLKTESEEKLEKYSKVKQEYENKRSETEHKCKEFPYRITKADYKIAIDEMGIYNDDLQDIISRLRTKAELIQKTDTLKESAEELEDDIRTAEGELEKIRNELHKCSEIIRLCDEFLNRPDNMDISARVQQITEKVKMLNDLRSKEKGIISESGGKISAYKEALTDMQEKRIELIAKENEMSKYFTEECELGLVITEKELTLKQRCDIAMEKADKEFSERSIVDAQNRLGNVFRKYSSTLAAKYNPVLGDCFEDVGPNITRKRNVITLMWESKPIADKLLRRYSSGKVHSWRMTPEDYASIAKGDVISESRLKKLDSIVSDELKETARLLAATKKAGYQELLIAQMSEDMAKFGEALTEKMPL